MAQPSTLHRFRIDLSDVDRGVYQALDFRVAQHPSETQIYLLTRVLAYALNFGDGLAFSPQGLSDPDAPCIHTLDSNGSATLWIEIGNPSTRKLHKGSKAAKLVKVYTYKNPDLLMAEVKSADIHKVEQIEFYSIDSKLLENLALTLQRDNAWSLLHNEGSLTIGVAEQSFHSELKRHHC